MVHLHRGGPDNKEYYCNIIKKGRETWRTSETYKRRAGALKAVFSLAKTFGAVWNGAYSDHTKDAQ